VGEFALNPARALIVVNEFRIERLSDFLFVTPPVVSVFAAFIRNSSRTELHDASGHHL
jgi:hypothetical protein